MSYSRYVKQELSTEIASTLKRGTCDSLVFQTTHYPSSTVIDGPKSDHLLHSQIRETIFNVPIKKKTAYNLCEAKYFTMICN